MTRAIVKHPILVIILAAFAIFASQAQAGTVPHASEAIPAAESSSSGMMLVSGNEQQQEQSDASGEESEEEPDCE